jgi:hypothetical protein
VKSAAALNVASARRAGAGVPSSRGSHDVAAPENHHERAAFNSKSEIPEVGFCARSSLMEAMGRGSAVMKLRAADLRFGDIVSPEKLAREIEAC